ncbi:MAG: DUF5104 domain-containing protein [Clostridiales bacterium]|nr:DUF5104 domain-containing protein [Clostridiales bacterium]
MTLNQRKKWVSVLLCMALFATTFVGCGKRFSEKKYAKCVISDIKKHDTDAIFSKFAPMYQNDSSFHDDLKSFLSDLYGLDLNFDDVQYKEGGSEKEYKSGNVVFYNYSISFENVYDKEGRQYTFFLSATQANEDDPDGVGLQCLGLNLCYESGSARNVTFIGFGNSSDVLYRYDALVNISYTTDSIEDYGETVRECLQQHNSDAIYLIFAPEYCQRRTFKTDLSEFLEALYEMDLNFENATLIEGTGTKSYDDGELTYYDDSVVYRDIVDASGNKYLLNIYYTQTDTEHPENIGLQILELVLEEENGSSKTVTIIGRDINNRNKGSNYDYMPMNLDD